MQNYPVSKVLKNGSLVWLGDSLKKSRDVVSKYPNDHVLMSLKILQSWQTLFTL